MVIRINILKTLIFIMLVLWGFQLLAIDTPGAMQTIAHDPSSWLTKNWTAVALVISEVAGFLPGKFAGITKSIFSFLAGLRKKKSA